MSKRVKRAKYSKPAFPLVSTNGPLGVTTSFLDFPEAAAARLVSKPFRALISKHWPQDRIRSTLHEYLQTAHSLLVSLRASWKDSWRHCEICSDNRSFGPHLLWGVIERLDSLGYCSSCLWAQSALHFLSPIELSPPMLPPSIPCMLAVAEVVLERLLAEERKIAREKKRQEVDYIPRMSFSQPDPKALQVRAAGEAVHPSPALLAVRSWRRNAFTKAALKSSIKKHSFKSSDAETLDEREKCVMQQLDLAFDR